MDSSFTNERPHVLEEMNNFLNKKDELFAAREKKIQENLEQLKAFEERLLKQATELKEEKEALRQEREQFLQETFQKEEFFKTQQEQIDEKWKEVYDYEAKCQDAMARLVAEELKEQMTEMKSLEEKLQKESDMISDTSSMSALKAIMGELEGVMTEAEEKERDFLNAYETAAKKVFPNSHVVEHKTDLLCIAVGVREIRIFSGDRPAIHIVENRKNDKQLSSTVLNLNRLQTEWSFANMDNHLTAVKDLDESTSPEVVLRQVKKAISDFYK